MAEQVPSIGRVVHFVDSGKHLPAIVVDPDYHIIEPAKNEAPIQQVLTVFPFFAAPYSVCAICDPNGAPGTWHWPEYVPAKET